MRAARCGGAPVALCGGRLRSHGRRVGGSCCVESGCQLGDGMQPPLGQLQRCAELRRGRRGVVQGARVTVEEDPTNARSGGGFDDRSRSRRDRSPPRYDDRDRKDRDRSRSPRRSPRRSRDRTPPRATSSHRSRSPRRDSPPRRD